MSEIKWISYKEERDKRYKSVRPRVKHIITFTDYSLAQFYDVCQAGALILFGAFISLFIASNNIGDFIQAEVYTLKAALSLIIVIAFSALYGINCIREEFIEEIKHE